MAVTFLLTVFVGAASVSAHGYVTEIVIDGSSHVGYNLTIAPWEPVQDSIAWQNWATDTGFVSGFRLQEPDIVLPPESTNARIWASAAAAATSHSRGVGGRTHTTAPCQLYY